MTLNKIISLYSSRSFRIQELKQQLAPKPVWECAISLTPHYYLESYLFNQTLQKFKSEIKFFFEEVPTKYVNIYANAEYYFKKDPKKMFETYLTHQASHFNPYIDLFFKLIPHHPPCYTHRLIKALRNILRLINLPYTPISSPIIDQFKDPYLMPVKLLYDKKFTYSESLNSTVSTQLSNDQFCFAQLRLLKCIIPRLYIKKTVGQEQLQIKLHQVMI